jgi:Rad3-related DNA helicase
VPTAIQLTLKRTLADAMFEGKHAFLEAPTGTGKSIAIMTAVLAFQAAMAEQYGSDPRRTPRIIIASRTLAQMDQLTRELERLPYGTLVAPLASRERLCAQPAPAPGVTRAQQCRDLSKPRRGGGTGCCYLDHQNTVDEPHRCVDEYKSGGARAPHDIEDHKQKGTVHGLCSYNVARDLVIGGANVVLVTTGQLMEPNLFASNGLDKASQGSLVIFDEAHNLPGVAREAASLHENTTSLRSMREVVLGMTEALQQRQKDLAASSYFAPPQLYATLARSLRVLEVLAQVLQALWDWLMQEAHQAVGWKKDGATDTQLRDGAAAQALIADMLRRSSAQALFGGAQHGANAAAPLSSSELLQQLQRCLSGSVCAAIDDGAS